MTGTYNDNHTGQRWQTEAEDAAERESDAALHGKISAAYEKVTLSDEAEDRILAALKQAQASRTAADEGQAQAEPVQAAASDARPAGAPPIPPNVASAQFGQAGGAAEAQPSTRKRTSPWKIAIPVAAVFVVGAIGIGVALNNFEGMLPASNKAALSQTAPDGAYEALGESEVSDMYADGGGDYVDDFNTEEYGAIEERGFVATSTEPLSTVSADVDTAAYANLRRLVREGETVGTIPTGAVRIEEMLNYFDYDYELPEGDDLFGTTVSVGPCPWNPDTELLVMGFASAPESAAESNGSNLVFLIDTSGSMEGADRLELLQDSFATLLEGLDGDDRVSIVTYSGSEELVLEGARGDDDRAILRAIYSLEADGSTNGQAGLQMAYDVAERNYIEGGVNRIVMASDGDLNVGITSESDLHDYVSEKRETGIYLSVLGFGSGNYKDNKMETLADNGNGSYHYIDCIEEAERVLGKDLTANLTPLADDVKIQIEFNPATIKGYRLIGYENRTLETEDFRDDSKDAGEVGPSDQFTVAYEIVRADSAYEIPETELRYSAPVTADGQVDMQDEWLACTVRYRPSGETAAQEQGFTVSEADYAVNPGDDWNFAASVIETGMVLRDSSYKGTATLESALELLDTMQLDEDREGFRQILQRLDRSSLE